MAKVAVRVHQGVEYVWYYCPGCKHNHGVPSKRWNWNCDIDKPTLQPSVRHYIPQSDFGPEKTLCHYFVVNGQIRYCGDCQHSLNNQIVDMAEPVMDVPPNS